MVYEVLEQQEIGPVYLRTVASGIFPEQSFFDFSDFTTKGHRPTLEHLSVQWGAQLADSIRIAWAQESIDRGTSEGLLDALQAGHTCQGAKKP